MKCGFRYTIVNSDLHPIDILSCETLANENPKPSKLKLARHLEIIVSLEFIFWHVFYNVNISSVTRLHDIHVSENTA